MKSITKGAGKRPGPGIRPAAERSNLLPPESKDDSFRSPHPKWAWHYKTLLTLRDRLFDERKERRAEAAEKVEPHSMSLADSASDEIEHDLALAELSAEQDALYEVDQALCRIAHGTYGKCELTGEPISPVRLRAVPWTRFAAAAEAQLEARKQVRGVQLGTLGSVRREGRRTLEEPEEEAGIPVPGDETIREVSIPTSSSSRQATTSKSRKG